MPRIKRGIGGRWERAARRPRRSGTQTSSVLGPSDLTDGDKHQQECDFRHVFRGDVRKWIHQPAIPCSIAARDKNRANKQGATHDQGNPEKRDECRHVQLPRENEAEHGYDGAQEAPKTSHLNTALVGWYRQRQHDINPTRIAICTLRRPAPNRQAALPSAGYSSRAPAHPFQSRENTDMHPMACTQWVHRGY